MSSSEPTNDGNLAPELEAAHVPSTLMQMPVRTKRWNDPREPEDGYRLLICRYRPRGVARSGEPWDAWCSELSPSKELHADAYGKRGSPPIDWSEYESRFLHEMLSRRWWLEGYAAAVRRGETLTLLCSSACVDEERCHRSIIKRLLLEAASPPETIRE